MAEAEEKKEPRKWPGRQVVELDLRSLATLRFCYGILLFLDALSRRSDLWAHYSDFGVLPRKDLIELAWQQNWFSLHMASGSAGWLNLLFLIQALAAVALMVGWNTRLATFLSWLLLISVHSRNPIVLNGGDIYLRVILFWMLFLPWGQTWSLDARAGRTDRRWWMPPLTDDGKGVRSFASVAVTLQICMVYWFAAIPKTDPSWTADYSATQLALCLDQFLTPVGYYFRETFTDWLPLFTMLVIMWEFWGPFLLLFPFDRGQTRCLAILGFVGMHAGFGATMELGIFAWISALSQTVLLPSWFWDRPARRLVTKLDQHAANKWEEPVPYSEEPALQWFPREVAFYALLFYLLVWNLGNENCTPKLRLPSNALWLGHALRLDQRWNMFSPGPLTEDGWYVIEAQRRDGTTLDLFRNGEPVVWEKPQDVANTYPNQRWRKYMMNLWAADHQKYRLPYGRYLSRLWNRNGRGPREVSQFKIYFMLERTNLDGTEEKPEKVMTWQHWCFESKIEDRPPDAPKNENIPGN